MILNPAVDLLTRAFGWGHLRVLREESGWQGGSWRSELPAFEVLDEGPAEDSVPSFDVGQLLRR